MYMYTYVYIYIHTCIRELRKRLILHEKISQKHITKFFQETLCLRKLILHMRRIRVNLIMSRLMDLDVNYYLCSCLYSLLYWVIKNT